MIQIPLLTRILLNSQNQLKQSKHLIQKFQKYNQMNPLIKQQNYWKMFILLLMLKKQQMKVNKWKTLSTLMLIRSKTQQKKMLLKRENYPELTNLPEMTVKRVLIQRTLMKSKMEVNPSRSQIHLRRKPLKKKLRLRKMQQERLVKSLMHQSSHQKIQQKVQKNRLKEQKQSMKKKYM